MRLKERRSEHDRHTAVRTHPEASSVLKRLFEITTHSKPRVHGVVFRNPDGSIGRRDFSTHWLHWYPAKMFHRIPQRILESLPKKPITILDPFCGSGTVLLEGLLRGHRVIGVDVNPVARLISQVKTTPIDPRHLNRHKAAIVRRARANTASLKPDKVLDFWFRPEIRRVLEAIAVSIQEINHNECRQFFLMTFSSIVRHASMADPSIPPPVKLNCARAKRANKKYKNDLKRALALTSEGTYRHFESAVQRNIQRMTELWNVSALGSAEILPKGAEAARTGLPDASVDLVVTSPPYCGAQKYARSLRLEMLLTGIPPDEISSVDRMTLGTERVSRQHISETPRSTYSSANSLISRIYRINPIRGMMLFQYVNYLNQFAVELRRLLRPGGNAFVTFGTDRIAGIRVDFAQMFSSLAAKQKLRHVATLVDSIPSRGMMTIRHSSAGTIQDERVVWLRG